MARMDPASKNHWKEALLSVGKQWVACGIDASAPQLSSRLEGMSGLIDWRLHGQVSSLLRRNELPAGDCCLVPGDPQLGRPSFLLLHYDKNTDAHAFASRAKKLGIDEISLAESTFPEDFLAKLKQNLKKEGVRYAKLEPETESP